MATASLALATAGLFGLGAVMPSSQDFPVGAGGSVGADLLRGAAAFAAIGLLHSRTRATAAVGFCLAWAWVFVTEIVAAVSAPFGLPSLVAPAEAIVCLCAGWLLSGRASMPAIQTLTALWLVTLVLFGVVHATEATFVSSLIPGWIPFREQLPYLTSALMIGAGLSLANDRFRSRGAGVVALLFMSWLPLIHLPRLLESPTALGEWRFALTAVALIGGLGLVVSFRPTLRQTVF